MKRLKYWLVNLMIVVFLYSNVAIILNYSLQKCGASVSLPLPRKGYETFQLFGVFSDVDLWNHAIEIYGITAASSSFPEGQLVQLEVSDYFPFGRMDILGRVLATRHLFKYGVMARYEVWRDLAAKIRVRYNRAHPATPVEKVVIARISWPRREEGPEAMKVNERITILVSE